MTTRTVTPLPLPSHYQPADAGRWGYRPDEAMLATTAAGPSAQAPPGVGPRARAIAGPGLTSCLRDTNIVSHEHDLDGAR